MMWNTFASPPPPPSRHIDEKLNYANEACNDMFSTRELSLMTEINSQISRTLSHVIYASHGDLDCVSHARGS